MNHNRGLNVFLCKIVQQQIREKQNRIKFSILISLTENQNFRRAFNIKENSGISYTITKYYLVSNHMLMEFPSFFNYSNYTFFLFLNLENTEKLHENNVVEGKQGGGKGDFNCHSSETYEGQEKENSSSWFASPNQEKTHEWGGLRRDEWTTGKTQERFSKEEDIHADKKGNFKEHKVGFD